MLDSNSVFTNHQFYCITTMHVDSNCKTVTLLIKDNLELE